MKSTEFTESVATDAIAAASVASMQGSPDDLVNPTSREIPGVDPRLLDQRVWLCQPDLVHHLMAHTAAQGFEQGLAALAKTYLATSGIQLQPTIRPRRGSDHFLVLGHRLNPDATLSPELITRLEGALRASEENPDATVVVSGGAQASGVSEAEVMKRWLIERGMGAERVLQESRSLDTVENITLSTQLLTQQKARDVCLITGHQAAHRGACLLSSHLQHIDSTIRSTHFGPPTTMVKRAVGDTAEREKFLLFKDLGRILGLWTYRQWTRQTV